MPPDARGNSIHRILAENLSELGMPDLPCIHTRIVVRDGYCIARKYFFEGAAEAVWRMAEGVIEFYGGEGGLLRTIRIREEASEANKAA